MAVDDQGLGQRRKELEAKSAEIEVERKELIELKKEKEEELKDYEKNTDEIASQIQLLTKEIDNTKLLIKEKDEMLLKQDSAIKELNEKLEKLKKKKRFIWCG